jgi:hypothetical protein
LTVAFFSFAILRECCWANTVRYSLPSSKKIGSPKEKDSPLQVRAPLVLEEFDARPIGISRWVQGCCMLYGFTIQILVLRVIFRSLSCHCVIGRWNLLNVKLQAHPTDTVGFVHARKASAIKASRILGWVQGVTAQIRYLSFPNWVSQMQLMVLILTSSLYKITGGRTLDSKAHTVSTSA